MGGAARAATMHYPAQGFLSLAAGKHQCLLPDAAAGDAAVIYHDVVRMLELASELRRCRPPARQAQDARAEPGGGPGLQDFVPEPQAKARCGAGA